MSSLVRFGVSIDDTLLERFDAQIQRKNYANRSEAIRDLIRDDLVQREWHNNEEVVGTVTLIYDHHTRELSQKLAHLQHNHTEQIISVMHVHLDHHNCLEVLAVQGRSDDVQLLADHLCGMKGVKHGQLTMSTSGARLLADSPPHHHDQHGDHH